MLDLSHLLIIFISTLLPDCFGASSLSVKITHQLDSYHVCLAVLTKWNPCHKVGKKCIRHLLTGCQRTKPLSRRETEGEASSPVRFRDDEKPRHLLSSLPGKGGMRESWKSLFTTWYFSVASLKICSKFPHWHQTLYLISFCDRGWSHLLKDAFSCVQCTAQYTDKAPSHSGSTTSFFLLLIFCLLLCSFPNIGFYYAPFFYTPVIDSSACFQSCWVSPNTGYMTWAFS